MEASEVAKTALTTAEAELEVQKAQVQVAEDELVEADFAFQVACILVATGPN